MSREERKSLQCKITKNIEINKLLSDKFLFHFETGKDKSLIPVTTTVTYSLQGREQSRKSQFWWFSQKRLRSISHSSHRFSTIPALAMSLIRWLCICADLWNLWEEKIERVTLIKQILTDIDYHGRMIKGRNTAVYSSLLSYKTTISRLWESIPFDEDLSRSDFRENKHVFISSRQSRHYKQITFTKQWNHLSLPKFSREFLVITPISNDEMGVMSV